MHVTFAYNNQGISMVQIMEILNVYVQGGFRKLLHFYYP